MKNGPNRNHYLAKSPSPNLSEIIKSLTSSSVIKTGKEIINVNFKKRINYFLIFLTGLPYVSPISCLPQKLCWLTRLSLLT